MTTMTGNNDHKSLLKSVLSVLLIAAALLAVPLVAMELTNEVVWDLFDFAIAGALIISTGLCYVFAARVLQTKQQRVVLGCVLGMVFLLIWAQLAVGIFD